MTELISFACSFQSMRVCGILRRNAIVSAVFASALSPKEKFQKLTNRANSAFLKSASLALDETSKLLQFIFPTEMNFRPKPPAIAHKCFFGAKFDNAISLDEIFDGRFVREKSGRFKKPVKSAFLCYQVFPWAKELFEIYVERRSSSEK